jgi:FKBP-type peptidyl-prolyl cis-trans isomerase SlpA
MNLRPGSVVTLHYRLECGGQEVVNTFDAGPDTFTLGVGELEPRLEMLLLGLKVGDHMTYELGPGEAFGPHDPDMIHTLPRGDFVANLAADAELAVDGGVDFTLPNGQTLTGTVLEIDADKVRIDFNHPLAGLPVTFEVKILAIEPE